MHPEGTELWRHPPHAGAQDQPFSRQFLQRRDLLHRGQGGTVGQDEDADAEANATRGAGEPGQRDERVDVAAPGALRIVRRDGEVVDHPRRFETRLLRQRRAPAHDVRYGAVSHVAYRDSEVHRFLLLADLLPDLLADLLPDLFSDLSPG